VETSIKLARQYHVEKGEEGRVQVIACGPSYHGFTLTAAGIGCHVQRRKIYEPLLPGNVSHVSACYPYRDRGGLSDEQYVTKKAQELDGVFKTLGPRSVVAFIVEPVAGAVSCTLFICITS
jgi:adenosylmethionine-8-amino-7-oxononanoate aminotransferase